MDRRTFLKTTAGYGAASLAAPAQALAARGLSAPAYFGLHPFLEAHPEAVFVRTTKVAEKNDAEAKLREGFALAQRILTLRDASGVPLTHKVVIKPNLTATSGAGLTRAIVTDPFVVEGFLESMKRTGIPAEAIYVRESLYRDQPGIGYSDMARRTGVHYADDDSRSPTVKDCSDSLVLKRTKFLGPYVYPDSYVINIAKFKTHTMGLTLCVKNLQGTNVPPYIQFCAGIQQEIREAFQADAQSRTDELFARHKRAGLPRWDAKGARAMEMWAHRTVDNYELLKPTIGLNIIEGVYAQNGDAFNSGPGPGGKPQIFLTNVLLFGKDAFRVDIIGHYLAGHEPGNFGLFHIAKERGASTALNPRNIPIYRWEDSGPKLASLESLARTPLSTLYLARPGERKYHFCDEPFAYAPEPAPASLSGVDGPRIQTLGQWRPDRRDSSLVMEYSLPADGYASVELYDAEGARLAVLDQGWMSKGVHAGVWATAEAVSGAYYCRLRADGVDRACRIRLAG